MRNILSGIALLLLISCSEKQNINSDLEGKILDLIIESSSGKSIEFPELYDILTDKIPDDKDEKLKLVEKLKAKGFKITDWGRGNYPPLGPRIIIVKLKKEDCECEVSKIYYSTISDSTYKMTERIKCQ